MAFESINWMAGGPQGSGVDTASNIFGRACGLGGLNVFGRREYHSNIKGLHSYFHLRVAGHEILANVNDVNLLAAFDAETVVRHIREVVPEGGVIFDSQQITTKVLDIPTLPSEFKVELREFMEKNEISGPLGDFLAYAKTRKIQLFPVPYFELLNTIGKKLNIPQISRITRMINTLTIGVSFALLRYDKSLVEKAVQATFPEKVASMNIAALNEAYEYTENNFVSLLGFKLLTTKSPQERIYLTGNQAVAMGKVLGGCRIQTYYPITPAADESEYLEAHQILKTRGENEAIVVVQTEDEIAAINSASGAALAGTRAATSTSGPGFSLMAEGLGWAGNNEVPIVVTLYQRGAPATGLPTRSGQADLRFAMHAGHGEFARIILASGDIRECFYDAAQAFNLAERYQMPVIHLVDKALANCSQTYPVFDYGSFKIDRGLLLVDSEPVREDYERFRFTESMISDRVALGSKNAVQWYTGDEHNEKGHISEEPVNRRRMMEKRMRKLELVDREVPIQERFNLFGEEGAENIVVSWGSPKGAIIEAIMILNNQGYRFEFLQLRVLHPLPVEHIKRLLSNRRSIIDVEDNYTGQLGSLIKETTGISPNFHILKYTGRPTTTTEIYNALLSIANGKSSNRQVLTYGS
jgi:2-oxoglutarate ferredoxin oxidoreductase subunit alpha